MGLSAPGLMDSDHIEGEGPITLARRKNGRERFDEPYEYSMCKSTRYFSASAVVVMISM